jgi:spoIIIJ-associated protein
MPEIEKSAESVEEAVEAALAELGVSEQETHIEIIQEDRSGFLGLKPQPAVVRVRTVDSAVKPSEEVSEVGQERASEFIEGLLEAMGVQAEVEIGESDGVAYIDVWAPDDGEDLGILIGRRGHTLDSLQELMRNHVQQQTGDRCQVLLDVEDYRKRQRSRVQQRAQEAARRVKKTGRPEALEPMGAYERKLVHDTVAQIEGLETGSEGEEPQRRVVIRRRV